MQEFLQNIVIAVVAAVLTSLSLWWKNATADGKLERYEFRYLWPMLLSAAASAGFATAVPGIPPSWQAVIAAGGPIIAHNVAKGVYRRDWGAVIRAVTGAFDLKNPAAPKA